LQLAITVARPFTWTAGLVIMESPLEQKPEPTSRFSLRAQQSRTRARRSLTTMIADEKACPQGSPSLSTHRPPIDTGVPPAYPPGQPQTIQRLLVHSTVSTWAKRILLSLHTSRPITPAISPERAPGIAQSLLALQCPSGDYKNDYENDYEMTMGQLRTDGMMHSRVPKPSARSSLIPGLTVWPCDHDQKPATLDLPL
jgi:hypothetical protein